MSNKLTKRRIDAVSPGSTIWDGELPGFGLRASKGGAKSYVLKYRRGRNQRWLTIGRHGAPWTPITARREAKRLIGITASGGDPAAERAAERDAVTLEAFAERYLAEYARLHKKASSVEEDERNLRNHILPALGRELVKDISRSDIAKFHSARKSSPYAANRCLALLSIMFNKAEAWGVRPDHSNPCRHVKKFKETPRERYLSPIELRRLGRVLAVVERAGKAPYVVAAIRMLLFTGARLSEILTLQWPYVDFEARLLRLPDSKSGSKTIALSAPALEILTNLPRQQDNAYVFCGAKIGQHLKDIHRPWQRLRKAALIPDVRLHDLRHSFASVAAGAGTSLPLIGSLLGHTQPTTTARYAHLADDPRLAAAERTASTIAADMAGKRSDVTKLSVQR